MEIITERLRLREFTILDVGSVHEFASDPRVCAFVEWGPNALSDSTAFISDCLAEQLVHPRTTWTLAITQDAQVIGSIALMCGVSDLLEHASDAEIGFVLRTASWGQGYVTEAATALATAAGKKLGITRLLATCRPDNIGSVRVLEKMGLRRIGYLTEHKLIDGVARDSVVFASSLAAVNPAARSIREA